ncbi:hypothetical protein [Cryobacterium ruanii]|uniref:DeoR C-terminal sensor domain-containing protein n=1 Tax=Cryobacterium ruanii TaxID=1259197 RepID=A0A4R9AKL1_9MICO|nr:hypothetical protein [Cryobacterium ruanii]TFD64202.1 hypothetical protein E3T47_11940 [Cryobacterium ruanii]
MKMVRAVLKARWRIRLLRRRVLALTSSKIGQNSFCRVADANEFDLIITDDGVDPRQARKLTAAGPELAIV